jgi:hypothetical protein
MGSCTAGGLGADRGSSEFPRCIFHIEQADLYAASTSTEGVYPAAKGLDAVFQQQQSIVEHLFVQQQFSEIDPAETVDQYRSHAFEQQ